MFEGFLGTKASFFPDFVVLAMFLVLPAFGYGIFQVRKGRRKLHAWVMGPVFAVLFVTVVAFVIWNRVGNDYHVDWEDSDFYKSFFLPFVVVHIIVALTGLGLGLLACISAAIGLKRLDNGELGFTSEGHRKLHRIVGWVAFVLFVAIALSGFVIYYYRYVYVHAG